mmetsp:Transcript_19623/g.57930  ORF Transcript_19623/g.57930 Transcript_19623/m.57930 type:complete len:104 (+) Transcript_19623:247-558(+)|eukprot:CAMPEP_0206046260 /NCGR_PEP_ID=MMETSP1466-20131121/18150_1 /ASSEMBLY_ACC=CAM_ASM_001126 /TAXON_ID=44452 /ORGANISM="Pavlova gyrans, Strain CCMP608" /LENGTH=103 /DNA_ID=CAMNT_0053421235 /DNA_START=232 /DNA_END=543 /DNA_ORIENTATION=-
MGPEKLVRGAHKKVGGSQLANVDTCVGGEMHSIDVGQRTFLASSLYDTSDICQAPRGVGGASGCHQLRIGICKPPEGVNAEPASICRVNIEPPDFDSSVGGRL